MHFINFHVTNEGKHSYKFRIGDTCKTFLGWQEHNCWWNVSKHLSNMITGMQLLILTKKLQNRSESTWLTTLPFWWWSSFQFYNMPSSFSFLFFVIWRAKNIWILIIIYYLSNSSFLVFSVHVKISFCFWLFQSSSHWKVATVLLTSKIVLSTWEKLWTSLTFF